MANSILSPRESTIRQLFAVSLNQCAFPDCTTPIINSHTNTILAEVCHIHAQRDGGPRYDASQSDEERHGYENLILMCRVHHKIIDAPESLSLYTADQLRQIKQAHEERAKRSTQDLPPLSDGVLKALKLSATSYESGSFHMDFRNTTFRVGGEGGSFGGGGGGGGVLTIIGISRIPPEVAVELGGEDGKAPGGGGGGGGAISYLGRPVENADLERGLRISSVFTANAVSLNGLLNILGAAWTYCPIPHTPHHVKIKLVFVLECGSVDPDTLLRVDIAVLDPRGESVVVTPCDVAIPSGGDPVRRVPVIQQLAFQVATFGVWSINLRSGELLLADYHVEFRCGPEIPT